MSFSNSLIFRSFLIVSVIVVLGLPLHLIYSPYYRIHKSSLYMPKPPKSSFASHKTPVALLNFNHPARIQCFTPPSISPLLLIPNPIYFALLLLKQKSYVYKTCLEVSKLPFNYLPSTLQVGWYHLQTACILVLDLGCVPWVHPKLRWKDKGLVLKITIPYEVRKWRWGKNGSSKPMQRRTDDTVDT